MGRLDVILSNIQLHSCILIGCILYGMVWLLITKGIRIELGAHFDNGRRTAGCVLVYRYTEGITIVLLSL